MVEVVLRKKERRKDEIGWEWGRLKPNQGLPMLLRIFTLAFLALTYITLLNPLLHL